MGVFPEALDAVVGLGSNVGDAFTIFRRAREALAASSGADVLACSQLYGSRPMGGPEQPDFTNSAIRVHSILEPLALLDLLLAVESDLGRIRRERWGPRTIDLDLLWVRGISESSARLLLPHALLRVRPFALIPLLDVAPDAVDPGDGISYRQVLDGLDASGVRVLARDW